MSHETVFCLSLQLLFLRCTLKRKCEISIFKYIVTDHNDVRYKIKGDNQIPDSSTDGMVPKILARRLPHCGIMCQLFIIVMENSVKVVHQVLVKNLAQNE